MYVKKLINNYMLLMYLQWQIVIIVIHMDKIHHKKNINMIVMVNILQHYNGNQVVYQQIHHLD